MNTNNVGTELLKRESDIEENKEDKSQDDQKEGDKESDGSYYEPDEDFHPDSNAENELGRKQKSEQPKSATQNIGGSLLKSSLENSQIKGLEKDDNEEDY